MALLDTHVLLWWLEDQGLLSARHREILDSASADSPLRVSVITLWEVAMLESLGRIRLAIPLRDWLEAAVAPPLVRRQGITPAIAAGRLNPIRSGSVDPPWTGLLSGC